MREKSCDGAPWRKVWTRASILDAQPPGFDRGIFAKDAEMVRIINDKRADFLRAVWLRDDHEVPFDGPACGHGCSVDTITHIALGGDAVWLKGDDFVRSGGIIRRCQADAPHSEKNVWWGLPGQR